MERRHFLKLSSGAALGGALAACGGSDSGPNAPPAPPSAPEPVPAPSASPVIAWNEAALKAISANRTSPPIAARSLAIMHTAMYDAWAAYDSVALGTRLGAQLRRPRTEHIVAYKTRAISFAAYTVLIDQLPTQKSIFDAQMAAMQFNPADASADRTAPQGIGAVAALAALAYCHQDGANQLGTVAYADYSGYVARNPALIVAEPTPRSAIPDPGHWAPLTFRDAAGVLRSPAFVVPFWGSVKPFGLASGNQFRPGAPAAFGTREFVEQAEHVIAVQQALTDQQKALVEFWAGGSTGKSPAAYWIQFGEFVSARDRHDLDADIKLFFALSNATFDAGIASWDAKRAFDSARPISAIRYLMNGQSLRGFAPDGLAGGLRTISGEAWVPFHLPTFPTPPFPDHVSGHSTFSAASAEVLRSFTGSDAFNHSITIAPRSMLYDPALPSAALTLQWATFSAAAAEAGASRIQGGIHFEAADSAGRTLGRQVGAAAFQRAQNLWLGRA